MPKILCLQRNRDRFRRTRLLLLAATLTCPSPAAAEPQWQRLADMPHGVFKGHVTRSGSYAVVTGGLRQTGRTSNLAQMFDLNQEKWVDPIPLHQGRCFHTQITLSDGRILIAGGRDGVAPNRLVALASCELIDVERRQATQIAVLPRPAAEPTGHLLPDGRLIIIGRRRASIFDPTRDRWARHIGLRHPRRGHTSVVLPSGQVLVIGGDGQRSLELVTPNRGVSRQLAVSLPYPLDDAQAVLLAGARVWITGGQDSNTGDTTDRTWIVNLAGPSSMVEGPRLNVEAGVADHCLVPFERQWLILVGGESQRQRQDRELRVVRLLSPEALSVKRLANTDWPHDDAAALSYRRGVIVFGGLASQAVPGGDARLPVVITAVERLTLDGR